MWSSSLLQLDLSRRRVAAISFLSNIPTDDEPTEIRLDCLQVNLLFSTKILLFISLLSLYNQYGENYFKWFLLSFLEHSCSKRFSKEKGPKKAISLKQTATIR